MVELFVKCVEKNSFDILLLDFQVLTGSTFTRKVMRRRKNLNLKSFIRMCHRFISQ